MHEINIELTVKTLIMSQYSQINAVLLNFLFSEESWRNFHQNINCWFQ